MNRISLWSVNYNEVPRTNKGKARRVSWHPTTLGQYEFSGQIRYWELEWVQQELVDMTGTGIAGGSRDEIVFDYASMANFKA